MHTFIHVCVFIKVCVFKFSGNQNLNINQCCLYMSCVYAVPVWLCVCKCNYWIKICLSFYASFILILLTK